MHTHLPYTPNETICFLFAVRENDLRNDTAGLNLNPVICITKMRDDK